MTVKLSGIEHTCVIVAAGGYGGLLAAGIVQSHGFLVFLTATAALALGAISFVRRRGWQ